MAFLDKMASIFSGKDRWSKKALFERKNSLVQDRKTQEGVAGRLIKKDGKTLTYEISKKTINEWMEVVYKASNKIEDLENALSVAKIMTTDDKEMEIINTVATMYREECSGNLFPPVSMLLIYSNIVRENMATI